MVDNLIKDKAFINGNWVDASQGGHYFVRNPANDAVITSVPDMTRQDVVVAIDAASAGQRHWAKQTAKARSAILRHWQERILQNSDALARIITLECGKPLAEASGEVIYGASFIEWFAEEGKRIYGDVIPSHGSDKRLTTIKQPVGVCAAITPWNFPIAMITRKVAPALAAGCSVVVKPAEATPLSALALAALAVDAGLPPGVLNVVTAQTGQAVGQELCTHPNVRKVSFTGSTKVGKLVLKQCADTVKRVSMELGGNAPFIVFQDADIDAAVAGAVASKYRNAGQTCVCTNRFIVHKSIYQAFADKLVAAVESLSVGNGLTPKVNQGPLINQASVMKVESHIADAIRQGAQVACGGHRHALGGNFFQPTVLTDVTRDMLVTKEETFGPIAPLLAFDTEDEAIAIANDTEYGLAAYFYSRDIYRITRVSEALEFGLIGINDGIISTEVAPFGGMKASGLGREGSKYGIDEYLETKYMCLGGI